MPSPSTTASVAPGDVAWRSPTSEVAWDRLGGAIRENDMLKVSARRMDLAAAELDGAGGGRRDRVLRQTRATLRPDPDLGYRVGEASYSRGAGAGLHPGGRLRLRGRRGWSAGSTTAELRAAPVLLLRHPQRLLRGDRQAPSSPADLGHRDARSVPGAADGNCMRLRTHTPTTRSIPAAATASTTATTPALAASLKARPTGGEGTSLQTYILLRSSSLL